MIVMTFGTFAKSDCLALTATFNWNGAMQKRIILTTLNFQRRKKKQKDSLPSL